MPHVTVKLWPGKSQEQKRALAQGIEALVTATLGVGPGSVSVRLLEVPEGRWRDEVYLPEIAAGPGELLKEPGYRL